MIDLDDIRYHMGMLGDIGDTSEYELLSALIAAATRHIESYCGIALAEDYPDGAPEDMKQACRMLVGHLYENREATIAGVTLQQVQPGAYELLSPYREWEF